MDATQRTPRPRSWRWTPLGYVLLGLGLTPVGVQAAPIRGRIAFRASAAVAAAPTYPPGWSRFLAAPDAWSSSPNPPFSLPVRRAILQVLSGDPAAAAVNPLIDYLLWRRDLNPFRFDRFHPYLGPQLGQLVTPPTLAPLTAVPIVPVVDPPILPLAPLTTSPPAVPEPSSLVLIALVSAWGVWKRSRSK